MPSHALARLTTLAVTLSLGLPSLAVQDEPPTRQDDPPRQEQTGQEETGRQDEQGQDDGPLEISQTERGEASDAAPGLPEAPLVPRVRIGAQGADAPAPGLTAGIDWLEHLALENRVQVRAARLPEGAVLAKMPGRLLTSPTGHRIFVPDDRPGRSPIAPMLLLPNRTLQQLDALFPGAEQAHRVVLSGQMHAYDRRNYLMLTAFSRGGEPGAAAEGSPAEAAPDRPSALEDPDVEELIGELEALRNAPTGLGRPDEGEEEEGVEPERAARAVPADTLLVRRTGRMERRADGTWAFVFDTGVEHGGEVSERPMTLLPCALLEAMESRVADGPDQVRMILSGRVTVYDDRNYVLPTLLQTVHPSGVRPIQ